MDDGIPVGILDVKAVKNEYPHEYEVYRRLETNSVIGVPFGPNPVGFLAIRNLTRYINRTSMMSILAYALHRAMAQQKAMDSSKLVLSPAGIQSDREVIINFFGSISIYISSSVLHGRDFNSPKNSRVVTYLILNRKSAHSPLVIVEALWPESEDTRETLSTYIRGYIRTFRKAFSLISTYQLIESTANGYQISHVCCLEKVHNAG